MKAFRQLVGLILALSTLISFSQNGINYKALIKDNSGNAITSQSITVQFKVLKGVGLTNVYQETHNPTTDANGVVMVNIGEGTVDSGVFADIDWGSDEHHLNVQVNTGGGLVDLGTTQFMAVPYAHHASRITAENLAIDDLADGRTDDADSSIFLGLDAGLNDDNSNNNNVGLGQNSLKSNTSGHGNVAVGPLTLRDNTTGYDNASFGSQALLSNTEGFSNTAVGHWALTSNTTGTNNTASGESALGANTTGNYNTGTGLSALSSNTNGAYNTGLGVAALYSSLSGFGNTAIGHRAGYASTGDYSVYLGADAGRYNTDGYRLYIESSDADANNALVYGEFGTDNTTTGNILRTNSEFQVGNPALTGYAFPTADGTADQVLRTDGSGSLSWSASTEPSGLELINEGSSGYRLIGVNPQNYGNIGLDAVDLSFNESLSTTHGATGYAAVSFGLSTIASGNVSTALGHNTKASGGASTAMGDNTEASGLNSTSMGWDTKASGLSSTSIGKATYSETLHGLAVGSYNVGGGSPTSWVETDPIFEVGNGNPTRHNALTVLKNGNVGIDTATPVSKLHITNGNDVPPEGGLGYAVFGSPTAMNMSIDDNEIQVRNNGADADLYLNFDGGNVITGSGNIGIGTVAPQEKLHVEGTIEVNQKIQAHDSGGLDFATDEGSVRLKVADNGRIGIGTTAPHSILDIRGYDPTLIIDNTATTGNYTLEFQENSVFRGSVGYSLTSDYLFLYEDGTVMVQNGNLGVGITSIPAGHRISLSGGAYSNGSTWTNSSSRDVKENFLTVDNQTVLERLSALPITEWNYIGEGVEDKHIGPMAEDFYEAFGLGGDPEAISTVDIAGVNVAAIQALYQNQQDLKKLNQEQNLKLLSLQGRISDLTKDKAALQSHNDQLQLIVDDLLSRDDLIRLLTRTIQDQQQIISRQDKELKNLLDRVEKLEKMSEINRTISKNE